MKVIRYLILILILTNLILLVSCSSVDKSAESKQESVADEEKQLEDTDTGISDVFEDTELEKAFKSSIKKQVTSISTFKIYEPSNKPTAFVASPVRRNDEVLGILVFQLDPILINTLATNYIGLGQSGEIVIASLEGEYAVVAAPLRHDPQAAFKMKIKIGSVKGLPIQDAAKGNEGSGISIDYRGKEVYLFGNIFLK